MSMRSKRDDPEVLLEAATTAARGRDADGRIRPSPAWADLDAAQRDELFARQWGARQLEAALDREGLSTTGRAVVSRIFGLPQLGPD